MAENVEEKRKRGRSSRRTRTKTETRTIQDKSRKGCWTCWRHQLTNLIRAKIRTLPFVIRIRQPVFPLRPTSKENKNQSYSNRVKAKRVASSVFLAKSACWDDATPPPPRNSAFPFPPLPLSCFSPSSPESETQKITDEDQGVDSNGTERED